jgi:hypothetical protein
MNVYLERTQREIDAAVRGMTREEFQQHAEGKWSIAEILEHLCRAFTTTVPHVNKSLDRGAPTASQPTLRQLLTSTLVVGFSYFPSGRSAPAYTLPKGMAPEEALAQIRSSLVAMDSVLRECTRRFGGRVKLADHSILGPLSANQWAKFHWVHTHHHVQQIARMRTTATESRRKMIH